MEREKKTSPPFAVMSSVYAPINPRVFAWARESAGYTVETAAKKIGRPPEDIVLWESDEKKPTLPQAKKAADVFHRPLGFFFLPEPPEEKILPDFRTFPDSKTEREEPKLRYFARRMVRRCEWAAEFRRTQGESPRAFVGAANLTGDPTELAEKIRRQLRIQPGALHEAGDKKAALQLLADNIRNAGVFVFSTDYIPGRDVDIKDMRGLAVSEPLAPAVAYNAADYGAGAKIFTLVHEMVHLWLGREGISAEPPPERKQAENARVERFCNQVAGEVLIPKKWILANWPPPKDGADESISKSAEHIAQFLCVSADAAARRAMDCGLIQRDVYSQLHTKYAREAIENHQRAKEARKMQGLSFGIRRGKALLAQSGRDFAALVLSAYYKGDLHPLSAAGLLGTKRHDLVDDIAKEVLG